MASQTGVPGANGLLSRLSLGPRGRPHPRLGPRAEASQLSAGADASQFEAVCRDSAPCTRLCALEPQQPSCPARREPRPLPALQEALKAAPPTCLGRASAPELELAPLRSPTQEGKFPLFLHPTWSHSIGWSHVRQENRCWGPAQKC